MLEQRQEADESDEVFIFYSGSPQHVNHWNTSQGWRTGQRMLCPKMTSISFSYRYHLPRGNHCHPTQSFFSCWCSVSVTGCRITEQPCGKVFAKGLAGVNTVCLLLWPE